MSIPKPTKAELKKWESILTKEGLDLHVGNKHKLLTYVEDTDIFQSRKIRTGIGGRLRKYKLGSRRQVTLTCQQCSRSFTAKRKDARFHTDACRQKARDTRHLTKTVTGITAREDGEES